MAVSEVNSPPLILVVEDNIPNQLVTSTKLQDAGYDVEVVTDGRAAIKALELGPFDLVLMDCLMPVHDGFATTREIRSTDSNVINKNIPIIALTALAMKADEQKCLNAGMNGFVSKPINATQLVAIVKRYLDRAVNSQSFHHLNTKQPARHERVQLEPELLDALVDVFIEEAPQYIADLRSALSREDWARLEISSHKLRGASDFLGTTAISSLASSLEQACNMGRFREAGATATKLMAEMQKLLSELSDADIEDNV